MNTNRSFAEYARLVWTTLGLVVAGLAVFTIIGTIVYHSMSVVIMLAVAILLAMLLNPLVEWLSTWVPRWLAIVLVYLVIFGCLALVVVILVPLLVKQGTDFITNSVPKIQSQIQMEIDKYQLWYQFEASDTAKKIVDAGMIKLQDFGKTAGAELTNAVKDLLAWAMRGVIILVMSIYLLLDKDRMVEWFEHVTPAPERARIQDSFRDIQGVLGGYLRGLAMMVAFVGISVSVLLLACHIHAWLFIGVVAGLLEVIPYFGAVAGAIPAVTLGFQQSPALGIGLIVAFIVINQIEGHVVAPLAYGHSMHMRPLAVLLALLVGAEVAKVIGMIVAVPVFGIVRVLWTDGYRYYRQSLAETAAISPPGDDGASLAGTIIMTPESAPNGSRAEEMRAEQPAVEHVVEHLVESKQTLSEPLSAGEHCTAEPLAVGGKPVAEQLPAEGV